MTNAINKQKHHISDGQFSGGVVKYAINGPYDRYQKFDKKLRDRLVREHNIDRNDPDSGAPRSARDQYAKIRKLAFKRYLAEIA